MHISFKEHGCIFTIYLFLNNNKSFQPKRLKFYAPKGKSIYILQAKKSEQTILSLIILSIPNVSHDKDNHTYNCMLNKFFWQGYSYHYIVSICNDLCLGE
jgi:hypothetical protein